MANGKGKEVDRSVVYEFNIDSPQSDDIYGIPQEAFFTPDVEGSSQASGSESRGASSRNWLTAARKDEYYYIYTKEDMPEGKAFLLVFLRKTHGLMLEQ
jgi:hypothetical protein